MCVCAVVWFLTPVLTAWAAPIPVQKWLTGRRFDAALEGSVAGTIRSKPLRDVLTELAAARSVAVVLDRRVNPGKPITIEFSGTTRLDAIRQVAEQAGASVAVLEHALFVGPPDAAAKLRTLIELRREESARLQNRRTLRSSHDFVWPKLTEPRALLAEMGQRFDVALPDSGVPHDLWAAGAIPDADAATALSVVLIQFGRTFQWDDQGQAITLVPEPAEPVLSASVRLQKAAPQNLSDLLRERYPHGRFRTVRGVLQITGSWEAIEAARKMARGEVGSAAPVRQPMANQRFKLKAQNVPARAVLEKLVSAGNDITWDEASLGAALEKRVDIDVTNATASELFESICSQMGAKFRVERFSVRVF